MRLHRNLGHPNKKELVRLLQSKNASAALIEAAQQHECALCDMHSQPSGVPVSSMPKSGCINHRCKLTRCGSQFLDSDTNNLSWWCLIAPQGWSQHDTLELARSLRSSSSRLKELGPETLVLCKYYKLMNTVLGPQTKCENGALSRASNWWSLQAKATPDWQSWNGNIKWHAVLSPSSCRQPDGCLWPWRACDSPQLCGAPDQQNAKILWIQSDSVDIGLHSSHPWTFDGGADWQQDPSARFMEKLRFQQEAAKATAEADGDRRLRRALLRKFMGKQTLLGPGDLWYYWRDASAAKLRWRGPATVIMREPGPSGPSTDVYWIGHGTVLLRAAFEHLKPAQAAEDMTEAEDPLDCRTSATEASPTTWTWARPTSGAEKKWNQMKKKVKMTEMLAMWQSTTCLLTIGKQVMMAVHGHASISLQEGSSTCQCPQLIFLYISSILNKSPTSGEDHPILNDLESLMNGKHPKVTVNFTTFGPPGHGRGVRAYHSDGLWRRTRPWWAWTAWRWCPNKWQWSTQHHWWYEIKQCLHATTCWSPWTFGTYSRPSSTTTRSTSSNNAYEPGTWTFGRTGSTGINYGVRVPCAPSTTTFFQAHQAGNFAEQRARVARQETLLLKPPEGYAPQWNVPAERPTPYPERPLAENERVDFVLDVDFLAKTSLPAGWTFEDGILQLGEVQDECRLQGNHIIRYHYLARNKEFKPTADNCPIPLEYLSNQRYTKLTCGKLVKDKWTRTQPCRQVTGHFWTGYIHKLQDPNLLVQSGQEQVQRPDLWSRVHLPAGGQSPCTSERALHVPRWSTCVHWGQEEKIGILLWEWCLDFFDSEENIKPGRVLRAKFILNWKRNDDGTPRAKARLICQGYQDPDALNGSLATASPTLTRLSRGMILSITSLLGFFPFASDISTAFLQGKKYDPSSERELWIRLPKDADGLLGLPPGHGRVMKLTKPMYGLVVAPKAWFDEAMDRILAMGEGAIVQHPLDSCLLLAFDRALRPEEVDDDPPRLLAIFGIHVDDLLGCCNEQDPATKKLMDKLLGIFGFREWHSGAERGELSHCGAKITKIDNFHWKIHQSEHFKKQKPISIQKDCLQSPLPVTNGERTALYVLYLELCNGRAPKLLPGYKLP